MFEIKFKGSDIKGLGKELGKAMKHHQRKELIRMGLEGKRFIKKRIQTQSFSYAPLNREYVKQKKSEGYSTKTFIRTGQYLKAIKKKTFGHVEAWVYPDPTMTSEYGVPYDRIAAILEHGSNAKNIPPRPLWSSTMEVIKAQTNLNKFNEDSLKRHLYSKL